MQSIISLIVLLLTIYSWVVIIYVIMTWLVQFGVVNRSNQFVQTAGNFLYQATEPVLRPIRRVIPAIGGIDLSPIILLVAIWFIQSLIAEYRFQF